jgi:hypothetical protein
MNELSSIDRELAIPQYGCPRCDRLFYSERVANMHIAEHDSDGALSAMARLQNILTRTAAKHDGMVARREGRQ